MPAALVKNGDVLELDLSSCRGSEFHDAKEKVKEVPGRRWNPESKRWTVPATAQNADRILKTIRPSVDDELVAWIKESMASAEESLTTPLPGDAKLLIPWASRRMPWQPEYVNEDPVVGATAEQRSGIDAMARAGHSILADDVGLGKTFEAISAVAEASLRCCYEAGAFVTLGLGAPGGASPALSRLLATLQGEDNRLDPRREVDAMHGLWHDLAAGSNGPGSCAGLEAVFAGAMAEGEGPGRVRLARGRDLGGNCEVRGSLPELSPNAALALGPKLVIAPSSVKGAWARELHRWLESPPVIVVDAKTPAKRELQIIEGIESDAWTIVNWEQLRVERKKVKTRNGGTKTVKAMKQPLFEQTRWLAVIADEVHRAKNREASQTQGLWRCHGWFETGATGTPVMNSPDELWSILRWLWPEEYHERGEGYAPGALAYWPFYDTYVDYYEDHFGKKVITGVSNPDALRYALKGKLIRRLAPPGGRKRIYVPLSLNPAQQKLYDEAETSMWLAISKEASEGNKSAIEFARTALEGGTVVNLLRIPNGAARMVRLQMIAENSALLGGPDDSASMDDFEQRFQDSRPDQWVVFCKYKESCSILAERLRKKFGATVGVYTGDVPPYERTAMEDKFQTGGGEKGIDVMVGTIGAMKEGITLTSAHLMYFLSRDFVPDINDQCEGREDRKGQQKRVIVYIAQPENTVATDKVEPINRLKETIVKTIVPKNTTEEV